MESIAAIATARGTGGVAIVRISGSDALQIAARIFLPSGETQVQNFTPYHMYVGNMQCKDFLDFGMCVYFKAPHSFTGEDVVELHCHGGERISNAVLQCVYENGARPADRGEFTKRAFLNGKLTLSAAEGLVDMINAESDAQLRAGNLLFREKTISGVVEAQKKLKFILASLAADADYPEEGVAESEVGDLPQTLTTVLQALNALIATYPRGKFIKNGVSVALCGKPNVGKSSLLNALLGYDKAIVSDEAGTTRDAVEGNLYIDGVAFRLTDTAGLRDNAGAVEKLGIAIAKNAVETADIVLFVTDGADLQPPKTNAKVIRVFNKADIATPFGEYDFAVSAVSGEGLNALKQALVQALPQASVADGAVICEERHFQALKRAAHHLQEAITGLSQFPLDMVSMDILEAWTALGEITGETANERIIDEVFAKFCVGK